MKKKYGLLNIIIISLTVLIASSCENEIKTVHKDKSSQIEIDSSAVAPFNDSLKLKQGDIPSGWEKVKLWEGGYYIAFPKKPWKKIIYSKNRIEFHFPKKNYDVYASITDLSKEPAYNETKSQKNLFYEAILKDLIDDQNSQDGTKTPEIIKKEAFLCLDIYDAMRVELSAPDAHIYMECVLIGRMLYTMAFLIWENKTLPILQVKDQFFNSFGKDLQIQ